MARNPGRVAVGTFGASRIGLLWNRRGGYQELIRPARPVAPLPPTLIDLFAMIFSGRASKFTEHAGTAEPTMPKCAYDTARRRRQSCAKCLIALFNHACIGMAEFRHDQQGTASITAWLAQARRRP